FLSPLLVSYLRGFDWTYVFVASSAWALLMLLLNLIAYKEPEHPKSTRSIRETLSEAITVIKDSKFIVMVLIYSGFWIMYFQMYNTVLWYMVSPHVDMTPVDKALTSVAHLFGSSRELKFDVAFVTSLNAGTIIALQVFVSNLVNKMRALPTMIGGMLIGTSGFILLAISSNAWVFIFGVIVLSIGEMTTHPKYYSYVGEIAPKDKVAVYMGYSFLYGIIGSLVGNNLGAFLYERIAKGLGKPRILWVIFSSIGIMTVIGLALYDRFLAPRRSET
ncbi:MFS transporter, partial [bacterium]